MDNYKSHLQALIQLAVSDQHFNEEEKKLIYSIGKANRIAKEEIDELVSKNINHSGSADITFSALSFEERFQFLYDIIQLMKIDSKVFLSEIRYCEEMSEKLGFNKKVVQKLSARIYSDPGITSNRTYLMEEAKKYQS